MFGYYTKNNELFKSIEKKKEDGVCQKIKVARVGIRD